MRSPDRKLAILRAEAASVRCDADYFKTERCLRLETRQSTWLSRHIISSTRHKEKAIADYTAVLDMPDAPTHHKATALYNRGIIYKEVGETEKAIEDYSTVVQMADETYKQNYRYSVLWNPCICKRNCII